MPATKFQVVIDAPLTVAQTNAINKDIQSIVAKHVAKIDTKAVWGQRIPQKEWLGIWLKRFATPIALKNSVAFKQPRF